MLQGNTIDAVTLHEPYASMIRFGRKTIETRWSRMLRPGPLLICTAKRTPGRPPRPTDGMARCIVEVLDVRPMRPSDGSPAGGPPRRACIRFEPGRIAYPIRMLVRLRDDELFHVSGKQSRFTVELNDCLVNRVWEAHCAIASHEQGECPERGVLIGAL